MSFESLPHTNAPNHFNLLRLLAASAVIISHAYGLPIGPYAKDPLEQLIGFDLGTTAVLGFFAISGYFIALSFDRRRSNLAFILARITRIVPGLLVVSLLCAFVLGPYFTVLPLETYFRDAKVWTYTVRAISIVKIMPSFLPGVFTTNAMPFYVNGSTWTLFYEVGCYIGLFFAGLLGALERRRYLLMLLAWVPTYLFARYGPMSPLTYVGVFSVPFVFGMGVYVFRTAQILNGWLALSLFVVAFALGLMGRGVEELWSLSTAYGVLWLGFARAPALLAFNRIGDFSYGTYIYGFPIEQSVVALEPGISPLALIAVSLPLSILCGAMSWFIVERPALRLRMVGRGPAAGQSGTHGLPRNLLPIRRAR